MLAIFKAYIDVVMLRRGPSSMPYSPPLLVLTIAALIGIVVALPAGGELTVVQRAVVVGAKVVMYCSVIWLLLNAGGRTERFVQTMTALFGADVTLKVAQALVQTVSTGTVDLSGQTPLSLTTMVAVAVELWFFVVMSSILRAALGISVLQSVGVIFLISMLLFGALGMLLPELLVQR